MQNEIQFINSETVQERVAQFKELVTERLKKTKKKIIEIALQELQKFFRYTNENRSSTYWFPKRFRDECVKQGVKVVKKRGYSVAKITVRG